MKTKQIIEKLLDKGYQVEYSLQKNGRIRITRINDKKFKSNFSEGNKLAREILGIPLSEGLRKHLESIRSPKGLSMDKRRKPPIPEDIRKAIRRVNRKLKRQGLSAGHITITQYRKNIAKYGSEEAGRLLSQAEKYSKGLAYTENISYLKQRINIDNISLKNKKLTSISNKLDRLIKKDGGGLTESDLHEILNILYELEQGKITIDEAYRIINGILNKYK